MPEPLTFGAPTVGRHFAGGAPKPTPRAPTPELEDFVRRRQRRTDPALRANPDVEES